MLEEEQWNCRDCGEVAGVATWRPMVWAQRPENSSPAEYVTEPPEYCGECGSDNVESEDA